MDSSTAAVWTDQFSTEGVPGQFSSLPYFTEIPVFNANGVDPEQTPHSVASDLDLNCFPMSLLWDARHKRVKIDIIKNV